MGSDESLSNETLDVSVTKNFGQRVQKIVSDESSVKRRCSPRLRDIPDNKRPYYGPHRKNSDASEPENSTETRGKAAADTESKCKGKNSPIVSKDEVETAEANCEKKSFDGGAISSVAVVHTRNDSARVKETLRIYNKYYLHFVQEGEDENDGKRSAKRPGAKAISKKEGACENDGKRSQKRPDLKATSKMKQSNEILFPSKRFGHLPGIDVGYQFYSRSEMVAVGFHSHWLNGIDFMGESYGKMEEFKGYTFPLAVAIVLSGQYEDDLDNSEEIVYTGQGGNDLVGKKHQIKDQEMSRGNLALKNSMEQKTPVRVIRGQEADGHFKVYTYDGLYEVADYWPATGVSGFLVYKYRLKRLEGQPKLTSNQVQFNKGRHSRVPIKAPQLVSLDITEGQEDMCIPAINSIDDTTITGFTYARYNQVASDLNLPPNASGCKCKGNCTNPKTCSCARLNGSDFPYVRNNGGRLIEAKDVVFECGPNCGCGPGCINRISQRGLKYQLEVFRTPDRGWAVKTKDFIPSGAPVCEYIGELRRANELDSIAENDYIFEIDCWQTMKEIGGRERRLGDVSASVSNQLGKPDEKGLESLPEPEFCIDAGRVGNIARFINHSCDPNLFVQCVLSSHHDLKLARIVLFAADNIAPMQELTYDYGYPLDSVVDSNGNVRVQACHCGTAECRKRLY